MLDEGGARASAFDFEAMACVLGCGVGVGGGYEGDDEVLDGGEELVGLWLVGFT